MSLVPHPTSGWLPELDSALQAEAPKPQARIWKQVTLIHLPSPIPSWQPLGLAPIFQKERKQFTFRDRLTQFQNAKRSKT